MPNMSTCSIRVRCAGWSRPPASKCWSSQTPGRLDAEFVREAALKGDVRLDPFLHRVLVEEWERLGWPFQTFLAEQGLSSHMWLVARRHG